MFGSMRDWLLPVVLTLTCPGGQVIGAGVPDNPHFVSGVSNVATPLSPAALTRRIREAAVKYQAYAPIPRVGFYDVAYPADETEAKQLESYAVLLVTAICQDASELPLRRVYVTIDGKTIELSQLTSVTSDVAGADEPASSTFGAHRSDALYLIPIYAGNAGGSLFADFAKNRDGFKLGELTGPPAGPLKELQEKPRQGAKPSDASLVALIRREYPGFLAK